MHRPAAPSRTTLPILAALTGNVIWGFSYLFTRSALEYASPMVLLSHRFLAAFFFMNLLLLFRKEKIRLKGRPLAGLAALCATEPLCFIFESYGILYTNSVFAGVVLSIVPVVSLLFALVFLKEVPSKRQLLFALAPVMGVILITLEGNSLGIIRPIGVVLLLCSCLSSAVYKTANRKSSEAFTPFERTYFVLLVCGVFFTVLACFDCGNDWGAYLLPLRSAGYFLPLLCLSLLCSLLANLVINYAAARMPVFTLAVFGSVSTVCTLAGGSVFLHEPVTWLMLLGSALIIIGVTAIAKR